MTEQHIVVGYLADERGRDALAAAALLLRATGGRLTVATIYPPAWPVPNKGRVDVEWQAYVRALAEEALTDAANHVRALRLPSRVQVEYATGPESGSGRGLLDVAEARAADLIVVGSAPRGTVGRIAVGSTADQLIHGSPLAVLVAPRGYAAEIADADARKPTRLSACYLREPGAQQQLTAAAELAASWQVPLRLLTVLKRPRGIRAALLRQRLEWSEADLTAAVATVADITPTTGVVLQGRDVRSALRTTDWQPGEILSCRSTRTSRVRAAFLGDLALEVLRAAPCPTLLPAR